MVIRVCLFRDQARRSFQRAFCKRRDVQTERGLHSVAVACEAKAKVGRRQLRRFSRLSDPPYADCWLARLGEYLLRGAGPTPQDRIAAAGCREPSAEDFRPLEHALA